VVEDAMSDEEIGEPTGNNIEEFQLSADALEKIKDPESIRRYFEEGKTFQEILGYSDISMEKLYRAAYTLFQQRRYQECSDAFTFLTTINPYVHNYWLGLGMSEQMVEDYEGALVAYAMATMTDLRNPIPHYHSANCYALLGDPDSAITSLDLAMERAANQEECQDFKRASQELRQKLLKMKS
jgi:type III secretion system low calcium response chaperone LcrH/SycD